MIWWSLVLAIAAALAWLIARSLKSRQAEIKKLQILSRFPEENPNPVLRVGNDGRLAYANPAGREILEAWETEIGDPVPEKIARLQQPGEPEEQKKGLEIELGNRAFWFLSAPLSDSKEVYIYAREVTDYNLVKRELKRNYQQQETINSIFQLAQKDLSLEKFLSLALESILTLPCLAQTQTGAIFLADSDQQVLELKAQKGLSESLLNKCSRVHFGECLCGQVAQTKETVFENGINSRDTENERLDPSKGQYCVPMVSEEKTLGLLNLHTQGGDLPNDKVQAFLEAIANALAIIIERKRSVEDLQKNESNLRQAQEIAQLGNWEWDLKSNELSWSEEIQRIFGLTAKDSTLTYNQFLEHIHPEERQFVKDAINRTLNQGEPYDLENRILRPDGEQRIVNQRGELKYDQQGNPLRMLGVVQDITEHKLNQEQLELANKVFEHAIEGITITNSQGNIQYVNQAFSKITGYTREEAIGQNPRILKSDRHGPEFYRQMWKSLIKEGHWQGEIWNRRKNGEAYPEWLAITAIEDEWKSQRRYIALFHDRSDIRRAEEEIEYKSNYDALTGLLNKDMFKDRLQVALDHLQQEGSKLAVLAVDLDDFKAVNNSMGHRVGDVLLQKVARRLEAAVDKQATICRLGGDEFLILLQEFKRGYDVVQSVRSILRKVSGYPYGIQGQKLYITPSIGISMAPDDGQEADQLIKNSDLAMVRAKSGGSNNYNFFRKSIGKAADKRLELLSALHNALEDEGQFRVFYQPKVEVASGKMKDMEALVRWQHPKLGMVSPADFIPLAEDSGLIVPIGEWVLKEACLKTKNWWDAGYTGLQVAVNLSTRQLLEPNLLKSIDAVLAETGLPVGGLALEVTESAFMADVKRSETALRKLHELGIKIFLDDFGTGYSSLSYLRRLPIDSVKIDKSFVDDIPEDPEANELVLSIISMSHSLNLQVTAEGVENQAQLDFLKANNCDYYQGYYFSPALPVEKFNSLFEMRPTARVAHIGG